jgi:phosphatidate phosphatase APP1
VAAIQPGERLLIIGAGTGLDSEFVPRDAAITAIDITPAMMARLEGRARRLGLSVNAKFVEGQALEFSRFTVVSDIDDTIKLTEVTNRSALLRNTFLETFKPVPQVVEVSRVWAADPGVRFCYLSASPGQLFAPLSEFIQTNQFPAGALLLREFRWKDKSFFKLFTRPDVYRAGAIVALLRRFPRRRFVLVGDAGERDPEIYARLAGRNPKQIVRIVIRDMTGATAQAQRYEILKRDLSVDLWWVFNDAGKLTNAWPTLSQGRN